MIIFPTLFPSGHTDSGHPIHHIRHKKNQQTTRLELTECMHAASVRVVVCWFISGCYCIYVIPLYSSAALFRTEAAAGMATMLPEPPCSTNTAKASGQSSSVLKPVTQA